MTNQVYFYNEFSDTYLAIDPTTQGYELRALTPNDTPLAFTVSPTSTNAINICTAVANVPYCLDVWGDKKYTPHLANPGAYSGQQWFESQESWGYRFSNSYTGNGWFLDVYNDTKKAFMSSGSFSGQYWRKVDVNAASSSPSASQMTLPSPLATGVSEPSASVTYLSGQASQATPTATQTTKASSSSSGLNTGAKAGIGAGCAVVALLIALVLGFLLRRRRETRHNTVTTVAASEKQQDYIGTAELPTPPNNAYSQKFDGGYGDMGELPGSHQAHELAGDVVLPSRR